MQTSEAQKPVSYMSQKIPGPFVLCAFLVICVIVRHSESLGTQRWLTFSQGSLLVDRV